MKHNFTHYIYILFIFINSIDVSSQEFLLKITSKIDSEKIVLNKVDHQKKHKDSIGAIDEIKNISSFLKKSGYFTNTIDSIVQTEKYELIVYFSLKEKIENAYLKINKGSLKFFKKDKIKNGFIKVDVKNLQNKLNTISQTLGFEGKSFSKIRLINIIIKDKNLFADLKISQSSERTIDKTIIKGYNKFPVSFLKNYFNLKKETVFNKNKIKEISILSKNLKFVKEIKSPEFLFTKDSTLLYIYLKKEQNNSFDAIINFTSKENGGVLFNGNIDLELNNILDNGENFSLFWNSIGEERQEFRISTKVPYLFNSKYTPKITFSIYKQDSTFLNTKFNSEILYEVNSKIKVGLIYNRENSTNLKENIINDIEGFSNYFMGFQFSYSIPKNDSFFNDKFYIEVKPTLGERKTSNKASSQFKLETIASYIYDINSRTSIFLKNESGYLNSDDFINNELFRIGGANSIRGFNEQSIFTNSYTFFNLELRYLTSPKSYLYTITDYGNILINSSDRNLLALGLGYNVRVNKSQINIGVVLGKENLNNIDLNDLKFIFSWKTFF